MGREVLEEITSLETAVQNLKIVLGRITGVNERLLGLLVNNPDAVDAMVHLERFRGWLCQKITLLERDIEAMKIEERRFKEEGTQSPAEIIQLRP